MFFFLQYGTESNQIVMITDNITMITYWFKVNLTVLKEMNCYKQLNTLIQVIRQLYC